MTIFQIKPNVELDLNLTSACRYVEGSTKPWLKDLYLENMFYTGDGTGGRLLELKGAKPRGNVFYTMKNINTADRYVEAHSWNNHLEIPPEANKCGEEYILFYSGSAPFSLSRRVYQLDVK